jgi:hypothetical protein
MVSFTLILYLANEESKMREKAEINPK